MDTIVKAAFACQKENPNKRLQNIIQRVEERYFSSGKTLQDDQLAQVWAAGTDHLSPKKEKDDV